MSTKVTLIDAGTGNLHSVGKALEAAGAEVCLTSSPNTVLAGSKVVLPGVGAFGDFMKGLQSGGLDEAVREVVSRGRPMLGICVGMQALFDYSEEQGHYAGLSILPGRVVRFSAETGMKVPHTGWNQVSLTHPSPLWQELQPSDYAYFNHSYYCLPAQEELTLAVTNYGSNFTCAVQRDDLFGVQFHPEKSQRMGLQLLAGFLAI